MPSRRDPRVQQRRAGDVRGGRRRDRGQVHRARVPVQHGHAEQEERGRERAQQEVLDRRLLRQQAAAPGEPAQQVQRQGQDLQRDEHGEQVVGGGEQQHAADREQGERVDLGVADAGQQPLAFLGAAGHRGRLGGERAHVVRGLGDEHHADEREDQDRAPDEQGRPVHPDRALGGDVARAAVGEQVGRGGDHDRDHERRGQPAERERDAGSPGAGPGHERLDQHADHGHPEDQQHRQQLAVLDVRRRDGGRRERSRDRRHGVSSFVYSVPSAFLPV